jgi:NAD(P)-dependent dehydrogenase (short-subunit alcohol dehydrogenase family)
VALTARTEAEIETVGEECRAASHKQALPIVADQSSPADIERAVASTLDGLGGLDVLVNSAAMSVPRPFFEETADTIATVLGINLIGPMLYCQLAGRWMADHDGGRIINIASINATRGRKSLAVYSASKGGIVQLTRSLAVEWADSGIAVNAVSPGSILTPMSATVLDDERLHQAITRTIPLRRMGDPGEVASVVAYLALDAPDFVTGAVYAVDGGETAR